MAKRSPRTSRTVLSDLMIRQWPVPEQGKVQVPDGTIAGLGLRVSHTGQRSFYLTYTHQGRSKRLTLGSYPDLKLAAARLKASRLIEAFNAGQDPRTFAGPGDTAAPALAPKGPLFEKSLEDFVELYCKVHNKTSTAAETERLLRATFLSRWRGRALLSITTSDILAILDELIRANRPSAAIHAYSNIRTFFGWCESRHLIPESPCIKLKPPAKKAKRTRVLKDQELAKIWHAAAAMEYPYGPIVHLLILTLQRRGEICGMRSGELTGDLSLLKLPAERTKNGQAHDVPLLPRARALLQTLPRFDSEYVFPARGKLERPFSGYSPAKRALDALCPIDEWTLHDLRRTGATGLGNLGVAPHIIERILNHSSDSFDGVSGLYNRAKYLPQMREALALWAAHVKRVVKAHPPEKTLVVPSKRAQASAAATPTVSANKQAVRDNHQS
ncbi:MAG: integrase arm-type DNA-binding domain-containing protein [Hyphomicrobium sp.]|nr:integrase arm-type DNA-binding domain-containing protein [Hyphomicrobium sp.]